jgi:hypothetical protein
MKTEIYTCDVCGTQKKESNHWFVLFSPFYLSTWTNEAQNVEDAVHICSSQCAHKKLEEFLSK